jgi:hypothetical protein
MCAVGQQRNNLASASVPRYIVGFDQLKSMANDLGRINDLAVASYQNLKMQQLQKHQALRPQQPQMVNNITAPPVVKEMPSQPGRTDAT